MSSVENRYADRYEGNEPSETSILFDEMTLQPLPAGVRGKHCAFDDLEPGTHVVVGVGPKGTVGVVLCDGHADAVRLREASWVL